MKSKEKAVRQQTMPYPLRIPNGVRLQLNSEAAKSHRSLNGEILFRLENSLKQHQGVQA